MSSAWRLAILALLGAAAPISPPAAAADDREPVVVEFYLSQACDKSPAAAAYAASLRGRDDLVALVFHIDYWNILSNRKHGRWQDPYAHSSFSARQRIYNRKIRERGMVFTPQAIVNGAGEEVGSKRDAVEALIAVETREPRLARTAISRDGDMIAVTVDPSGNDRRDVYLVTFRPWSSIRIDRGENFGVTFEEPNVVAAVAKIGAVSHRTETFSFPAPGAGEGCAVIVQEENQGRIVGARYCP